MVYYMNTSGPDTLLKYSLHALDEANKTAATAVKTETRKGRSTQILEKRSKIKKHFNSSVYTQFIPIRWE